MRSSARFPASPAALPVVLILGCNKKTAKPVPPGGINIVDFVSSPYSKTVTAGTTVIRVNNGATHTVTGNAGSEPNSGNISNRGAFSHTFYTAGTYNYHCSIHLSMKGTIIVQ